MLQQLLSDAATANVIAILALFMSGGALALELRRWFESGPRLRVSMMADATMFPHDDGERRLVLTATNVGSTPTQITHMIYMVYATPFHRWLRLKPLSGGFVGKPEASPVYAIPYRLDVGGRWMGVMLYGEDGLEWRAKRQLYVGVHASHTGKMFLKKVPREIVPPVIANSESAD